MSPFLAGVPIAETVILFVVGLLATSTALLAVTRRNPLYGAVFLIAFFLSVAVLYFQLAAPFVGIMQVLVYAGAIMVLYTFIIMLLDLSPQGDNRVYIQAPTEGEVPAAGTGGVGDEPILNLKAALLSFGVFLCISIPVLRAAQAGFFRSPPPLPDDFGTPRGVGLSMFRDYALPFEVVGVMLLVAAISGVVLAKRTITDEAEDTSGMGRGLSDKRAAAAGDAGGSTS